MLKVTLLDNNRKVLLRTSLPKIPSKFEEICFLLDGRYVKPEVNNVCFNLDEHGNYEETLVSLDW